MDGEEHTIEHGTHFDCTPESMGILIRKSARRNNREIAVSVDGEKVHFQFSKAALCSTPATRTKMCGRRRSYIALRYGTFKHTKATGTSWYPPRTTSARTEIYRSRPPGGF
jgi:hypothetical protein